RRVQAAGPSGPNPAPRRPRSIARPPASDVEATPRENLAPMAPALSLAAEAADADDASTVNTGGIAPAPEAPSTAAPPGPGADDLSVTLGDREYRVRGLGRNLSYDSLKVTLRVARGALVGETTNTLVGYLAAVSRKLDEPLAVLIQSASAAGKTALMDALLAMIPGDEQILYSAVTGQALFYLGETDLAHKLLAIAEDEGVSRAGYALKLLQSE